LGRGRNGKGTGSELIKNAIGLYWGNLSMDYFTSYSKDADKPNQNLYNCRASRVLCSSEIGDSDSSNKAVNFVSGQFKAMTGGDLVYARELGTKNTTYFKAGKVLIQTNVMPSFSKIDTSLKERIVVMDFPYTFTDDKELILKDSMKYKEKDIGLKSKFSTNLYRVAMINVLFKNYTEYKKSFIIPDSVKKYTNTYFAGQSLKSWIDENCDESDDGRIDLESIKQLFKGDTGKFLSVKQIKDELIELELVVKRGTNNGFVLKHYKMKPIEQDNDCLVHNY
jgi:phage/plasmid-associated DNA primase